MNNNITTLPAHLLKRVTFQKTHDPNITLGQYSEEKSMVWLKQNKTKKNLPDLSTQYGWSFDFWKKFFPDKKTNSTDEWK